MEIALPPRREYADTALTGRVLARLVTAIEYLGAAILALDMVIVAASVVARYYFHAPFDWAEEIASGLMSTMIFLGAASGLGRTQHIGIDVVVNLLPPRWRPFIASVAAWATALMAGMLLYSTYDLMLDTHGQTTPIGLPQWWFHLPVLLGVAAMTVFAVNNCFKAEPAARWPALAVCLTVVAGILGWNALLPDDTLSPILLLCVTAIGGLVLGVPVAFALGLGSMSYFLMDPSLSMLIWAQQVSSGAHHFVLLAIPFFVLAGLTMEVNGMSSRLIELLLRMIGRFRGGLNLIVIFATMLFSGVSGSKLADIAAVGGVIMPAIRKTGQDENETAGLLACTAVMAETIPPCVNLIIFAFVSNISIGGLFMAGVIPAVLMALCLAGVAIYAGTRVDLDRVFVEVPRRPLLPLIGGAAVTLAMILMIGRGVTTGIATSTEISAFAVIYAFVVGGLMFRELTLKMTVALFVRAAAMTGSILFIVAVASSLSYALTIERIPDQISTAMIALGQQFGPLSFVLVSIVIMFGFGMILEGAPALILFGPLLTPIAGALGINPLQFGVIMVIAMGLGFFAPPIGVGLFVTNALTGTQMKNVVRPMMKYLAVLLAALLVLILVPDVSLWLPRHLGMIR
ncbi:TRAP transporter large permease subunit [Azospirillum sp. YIM B02556]|uniref:TRAP transporter large permease subunit n=1 Tax=Azospirillum endophyticum TaxID=2800326 RepID=A0ABS1EZV2_9PROT|nr:TRAP transporter large permease subunit [Azospirillum endophyticum]MBK1836691.1 TRAP transporter large permease subunit [Azospirillum endophyticum]